MKLQILDMICRNCILISHLLTLLFIIMVAQEGNTEPKVKKN